MSGTSFPETTAAVSDVNVGLVHDAIHDRGHDHHKREARTKTTAVMRQWSRFPRRASWWSECCNGSLILILSSTSDTVSLAIPIRSSDARGLRCTDGASPANHRSVLSRHVGASVDSDYLIVRNRFKGKAL